VIQPTPVRHLKRTLAHLESFAEPTRKRTCLSPNQLITPPSTDYSSEWRKRHKSSLLGSLNNSRPPTIQQFATNSRLGAWLDTIPFPRARSCPSAQDIILSPPESRSPPDPITLQRPRTCEARLDLVGDIRLASRSDRLTLTALQTMPQPESQSSESLVPKSTSSSNKAPGPSDAAYVDTLYGHGIVMDLSGRRIPQELVSLKERILQKRASPQLDDPAVNAVMDIAEDLAYNSEGPTNKILRTSMFPLDYGGLVEGGNTQWNTVALPNNPRCDNKLSAPKPDAYLAYARGSKSPWTVEQNNVVNHPKARPYTQPAKRNTFPSLSVELKAESAGGVLTTAEAQAAGSGSHSVNSLRWLLEQAKAAGLTDVDLVRDTVSFSIVASHRQAVAYLHWLDPEEKHFYMSYLRSYPTFEADSIRGCNNTIKNIIDNAEGRRQIQIGKALVIIESLTSSWNAQLIAPNKPPTPSASLSEDVNPRKRARESQEE
ncbi:MAG: hypothetical protein LQ349_009345, partial [Xanthoria aureola]